MNLQFYLEKLSESDVFKKFKKENKDAYLCSGFFSIDRQGKDNQQHLDFYAPSSKKMFSFQIEKNFEIVPLENYDERTPEKLFDKIDFDFDEFENTIINKMKDENINKQIQKLLLSLQNMKGKNFIIGTIFISGMGILKVTFDLDENKIINFEQKSFFDMMKIIKK
ncbi:MAG: hypothetical protein Q8O84_02030 [Nanoarchaeota archaeon]|nr:hypothetical protein [Nanoarchaeota archaeon]